MGFFGALGGALKAPFKPINKAVSKVPGMPTMGKPMGMAQPSKPPMNQGMSPSNSLMGKFGMMGQKMQQPPAMGGGFGGQVQPQQPPPMMAPPEPLNMSGDMQENPQVDPYQPQTGASFNTPPAPSVEEPIGQAPPPVNQGIGPSPRMMPRRPMMNRPRMLRD